MPSASREGRTLATMSTSANRFLRGKPPHPLVGTAITVAIVGTTVLVASALEQIAPAVSLGAYILGVLLVSALTGWRLGLLAALLSAVAFNWFDLAPTGRLTLADFEGWAALVAFVLVAGVASTIAELARAQ